MKAYRNTSAEETCKAYAVLLSVLAAVGVAVFGTGCSGMEVGGKLGVYRVDEHSESSSFKGRPVPLKCYFVNCGTAAEDVQGS